MFDTRNIGNVTVIEPKGVIEIGQGDVMLRETVYACLEMGARNILMNLAEVERIDSSGLGELVSAYTSVSNRGGVLKLCTLPAQVNHVLQITHLFSVFETYDSLEEAVDSF